MKVSVAIKRMSHTFFLFAILLLCISFVRGPPEEQLKYELMKRAIERQEAYLNLWNHLVQKGDKKEGTYNYNNRDFPIYRLDGKHVSSIKARDVFLMLQNWLCIIPNNKKHRFIEMNIGGEVFRFRLYQGSYGQILISTEKHVLTKYDDFVSIFEADAAGIAKEILRSSEESLNAQTAWTSGDAKVRANMRMFMIISQVAEAARPSDENLQSIKAVFAEVKTFELDVEKRN